jgi:hypothetical protein
MFSPVPGLFGKKREEGAIYYLAKSGISSAVVVLRTQHGAMPFLKFS